MSVNLVVLGTLLLSIIIAARLFLSGERKPPIPTESDSTIGFRDPARTRLLAPEELRDLGDQNASCR